MFFENVPSLKSQKKSRNLAYGIIGGRSGTSKVGICECVNVETAIRTLLLAFLRWLVCIPIKTIDGFAEAFESEDNLRE